jgi:hypothetical protein
MSCTSHKASLFFGVRGAINVYELNNLEEYVYFRPLKTRFFKHNYPQEPFFASKLFFLSCAT